MAKLGTVWRVELKQEQLLGGDDADSRVGLTEGLKLSGLGGAASTIFGVGS